MAGAAEAIAGSLSTSLRGRFPRSIGAAPVRRPNQQTSNNEAYRLYLRAQEKLDRRTAGPSVRQSAELFRQAIHQDTLYARAWSGLSIALAFFPYFLGVPTKDVYNGVVSAARRALDLDPALAQPHVALGLLYQFNYQWDSAATEFQTATRLEESNVEARVQYGRHFLFRGRYAEALTQLRSARTEDPASALVLGWMSYAYYLDRQMDSALVESRRALENDSVPFSSSGLGALVRLGNNLPGEAHQLAARFRRTRGVADYIIAKSGDTAGARQRLEELDAETPQSWLAETSRAYMYLGLGDTAKALSALERATEAKEIWFVQVSVFDPMFDSVRKSARFREILRRIGLAP